MKHQMTLTARQADRLNRIFRLGSYEKKKIQDYSSLHRMLANLFHTTYASTLAGESAKHGFHGSELVALALHGKAFDLQFWEERIGSYSVNSAFTSAWGTSLYLQSSLKEDIFLSDTFYLMTKYATFTVEVSSKGKIDWIEIIFEDHIPGFLRELIRDFPGHNAKSDRVTLHQINHRKIGADNLFAGHISFRKVVTIEV